MRKAVTDKCMKTWQKERSTGAGDSS